MKHYLKVRLIAFFTVISMLFSQSVNAIAITLDEVEIGAEQEIMESSKAPENYVPIESKETTENEILDENAPQIFAAPEDIQDKKVLLVQDTLPWSQDSNVRVLNSLGIPYEKTTTANFLTVDLSKYAVVIFANDQKFSAYDNYKTFKEYLELFAEVGGVIIFGACDAGWASGQMNEELPGKVKKENNYSTDNYIVDHKHPIVTGELIDNKVLQDSELHEKYTSHTYFVENTLPAGSKVILRNSDLNKPTLVEYPLGNGRVIASGLTWEYNYYYGGSGDKGTYSQTAMADMFLYSMRVSSLDVDDVKKLHQYYLNANAHNIVVASSETTDSIKDAKVLIDGKEYLTDENGMVKYSGEYGDKLVTITANGYNKSQLLYDIQPRKSRFFFLDKSANDGKPYATMVLEKNRDFDLKSQKLYFNEDDKQMCNITVYGEWNGKTPSHYVLYQDGQRGGAPGKQVVSYGSTGSFNIAPGTIFNPGQDVKLKLVAKDGTTSTPIKVGVVIDYKTNINNGQNGQGLLNQNSFQIAPNQSATVQNSQVTNVYKEPIDFKLSSLPIKARYVKDKNDGSYTLRATIGLGKSNYLDSDTKWQTFKKDFDTAASNTDRADRLAGLMQAFDNQLGVGNFTVTKKFDKPKLAGVGYYEVKFDAKGNQIYDKGGILVTASGGYTLTEQFLLGPIPIYFDIGGKVDVNASIGVKYDHDKDEWNYLDGSLSFLPAFSLGGGVGIKAVATVGVEGEAKLKIDIFPKQTGTFIPSASIKAYLLFIFDFKYSFASVECPLWPRAKAANAMPAPEELGKLDLISTEYLNKTTTWNSDALSTYGLNQSDVITSLQDWILPSSVPEIEKVGDKLVAVFQGADKSRNNANNSILMYSVYENNAWSTPKKVWDNGTADLYSNLVEYNDELYLVWQKAKSEITETDVNKMLEEMASKAEICYAKYDKSSNSFIDQKYLTDNKTMDMMPKVVANGKNIDVVWVNNDKNDVFGTSGTNTIMKSSLVNGKWSTPSKLASTKEYITELSAGYNNNKLNVAFVAQDVNAQSNSEVYIVDGNKVKAITDSNVENAGLQIENGKAYWQAQGSIYEYNFSNKTTTVVNSGENAVITSSFKLVKNNDKNAIVWISPNEDNYDVMAAIQCGDSWSSPINLMTTDGYSIQTLDTVLNNDGTWNIIMNAVTKVEEDSMHSLVFAKINPKNDVELTSASTKDDDRVNGMQPVKFSVKNSSEVVLDKFNIKISSAENSYLEKEINCNIKPGEEAYFTENIDLTGLDKQTDLTVSINSDGDTNEANNVKNITVGYIDVALSLERYEVDDNIVILAKISNASKTPANVGISIHDNNEDGIVLDMKDVGLITDEEDYVYVYTIDKTKVDFGESDSKYYYVNVSTIEEDKNEMDNSEYIMVYKNFIDDPSDEPIEEIKVVNVNGVSTNKDKVELVLNDENLSKEKLEAIISPVDASFPFVTWTSDNEDVAVVNEDGVVEAVGLGETEVTVTANDGEYKAKVKIVVSEKKTDNNNNNGGNNGDNTGTTKPTEPTLPPKNDNNKDDNPKTGDLSDLLPKSTNFIASILIMSIAVFTFFKRKRR